MPEIDTPQGELRYANRVHGVSNYLLTWFDKPEDWEFKQFVTDDQLRTFASANHLLISENPL